MSSCILALDQGTTSSRAILFDREAQPVASAQEEFKQQYPRPGWVEHDPEAIWQSQSSVAQAVLKEAEITAEDIAGIGITNQRETVVCWDQSTGNPIGNAIVWQDRRTADFCRDLQHQGHEDLFRERTGLRLDPYFSGTKIRWILDHVDGARDKADAGDLLFGTIDSWLVWKLTAGEKHITDVTNASRTLLFNIHDGTWDEELLEILKIPASMLPEVRSCSETYGKVTEPDSLAGIPIAGIAGDQQAALFGQGCTEPGLAKNTYGTGCFLLLHTGTEAVRSDNEMLTTVAWKIGETTEYALEGSVFVGGALIQWLRDELKMIDSAPKCDELAAKVEDADGVIMVPAFTGLGAPHWDPYARGMIIGLTRGTTRAHICRASLEAIAFQSADLLTGMEKDAGLSVKELRADGGASQSAPLMQFQADLLQTEVTVPSCIETTALGAAFFAGLAVGFWPDRNALQQVREQASTYRPERPEEEIQPLRARWSRAVDRCRGWEEPETT